MKSTVQNKIILNNQEFVYFIQYKRIKNIYFRVKEDLNIYVTAPKIVSKKYIETLLKENEHAIMKMHTKMVKKNETNLDIYYLGNKLILINKVGNPYISNDYIYAENLEKAKAYVYSLSYDVFSKRVENIKNNFTSLPNFKLRVRKMKSKWGVCNTKSMTITLNTDLISKDVHLIDYVIIHELCHFKYMNHSNLFWKEVAKYYPYYKEARKELNHS